MLNDQGYSLEDFDFQIEEFKQIWTLVEQNVGDLETELSHDEYLNEEQKKTITHHLDGAIGNLTLALEQYESIVETMKAASEAEFEAQEKAEMAGLEND